MSVPLIFLTTLLSTLSLIYSVFIDNRPKEYFWMFLLLEMGMLGVFTSLDFVLFFVFWEVSLVPMYFLIGIWGGPRREYAAIKFFLYTMVGSMTMLLGILAMYFSPEVGSHTFNMLKIAQAHPLAGSPAVAALVFWGIFLGFAIKVPMFPFHTWLPDAHVEAPTAGSVILAGVLLKMGTYGFMRVLMPMLPHAFARFWWAIAILSLIAIIYGAFVAMAQTDLKKLIAYSSVNHMGYVTLGCAVAGSTIASTGQSAGDERRADAGLQPRAFDGRFVLAGWRGLRAGAYKRLGCVRRARRESAGIRGDACVLQFRIAGAAVYDRVHSRGFGAGRHVRGEPVAGRPGADRIVVTAAYMLWMLQRVLLGPLNPKYETMPDANTREIVSLAPLMALTLLFGVYPKPIIDIFNGASQIIVNCMNDDQRLIDSKTGNL